MDEDVSAEGEREWVRPATGSASEDKKEAQSDFSGSAATLERGWEGWEEEGGEPFFFRDPDAIYLILCKQKTGYLVGTL